MDIKEARVLWQVFTATNLAKNSVGVHLNSGSRQREVDQAGLLRAMADAFDPPAPVAPEPEQF